MLLSALLDERLEKIGDQAVKIQATWSLLRQKCAERRVLILIDDARPHEPGVPLAAPDFGRLDELNAAVIFASRLEQVKGFRRVELKDMELDESEALFRNVYERPIPEGDRSVLRHILDRAGRHTMAVDMLASSARVWLELG